jgi:hypothetical protein
VFKVKELERSSKIDLSQVVDLYDEEGMLEEIDPDNLIIEEDEQAIMAKDKKKKKEGKKQQR